MNGYSEVYFKAMEWVILGRNAPLDAAHSASHVRCMPRVRRYFASICPLIGDSASSMSSVVSTFVRSHDKNPNNQFKQTNNGLHSTWITRQRSRSCSNGLTSGVRGKHRRDHSAVRASQKQLAALAKGRATAARNRRARKGR